MEIIIWKRVSGNIVIMTISLIMTMMMMMMIMMMMMTTTMTMTTTTTMMMILIIATEGITDDCSVSVSCPLVRHVVDRHGHIAQQQLRAVNCMLRNTFRKNSNKQKL